MIAANKVTSLALVGGAGADSSKRAATLTASAVEGAAVGADEGCAVGNWVGCRVGSEECRFVGSGLGIDVRK